jgi:hypothetical protein
VNPAAAAANDIAYNLVSNKVYQVRVRAATEVSGEAVVSQWSTPVTLNVQSGGAEVRPEPPELPQGAGQ